MPPEKTFQVWGDQNGRRLHGYNPHMQDAVCCLLQICTTNLRTLNDVNHWIRTEMVPSAEVTEFLADLWLRYRKAVLSKPSR